MYSVRRSVQTRSLLNGNRLFASEGAIPGKGEISEVGKGARGEIVVQGPANSYDPLTIPWNPEKFAYGWRPDQPLGWHGLPADGSVNYRNSEYYIDPVEFENKRLAIANPRCPQYIIDFIRTPPKGTAPDGTWIAIGYENNVWHYEIPRIILCFVIGWFWFYAQNLVIYKRPPMNWNNEFWVDYEIRSWYKERQVAPDKPVILNPISRNVPGWIRYSQDLDKWAEWEADQPPKEKSFYQKWFGDYFHKWFGW
eukprot:TRINITY_DN863_c0_g1_i1.p2 TRINITY_DN863_c0_g1~~TRINITY_DN863_c0_g1_i1.p2  ORF type:complete len:280 (+),score=23.81 TRINITY_DN863_c0_g1_i1:87-842(+)